MTVEDVLRETFADQEQRVEPPDLAGPVRARVVRHRKRQAFAAAAAVIAVLGAVSVVQLTHRPPTAEVATGVPDGWRPESFRGIQIHVPPRWREGELACVAPQESSSIVQRAYLRKGVALPAIGCSTAEPATSEGAVFAAGVDMPGQQDWQDLLVGSPGPEAPEGVTVTRRSVTIGDRPAVRAEYRLKDGRFAGWVRPAGLDTVSVRSPSAETTRRILDSVELVDVDANGCRTDPPTGAPPKASVATDAAFVPQAAAVRLCSYADAGILLDSAVLTGADAATVVSGLNRAKPGKNPNCTRYGTPAPVDLLMDFLDASNKALATVHLRYSGCMDRGFDNGTSWAQVTPELLKVTAHRTSGEGYFDPSPGK